MNKPRKEEEFQEEVNNQEDWEDLMSKDGLKGISLFYWSLHIIPVIDVYQDWSGPCQSVKTLFKKLKEELDDPKLFFAIANVDSIDSLRNIGDALNHISFSTE